MRMKNSLDTGCAPGKAALRVAIFRVNKDQVDIRRDIQLTAALLAHRQHHQCLLLPRFLADGHAVLGDHLGHDGVHMRADGEIGKPVMAVTTSFKSAWPPRSRAIRPHTSKLRRRRMARSAGSGGVAAFACWASAAPKSSWSSGVRTSCATCSARSGRH